MIYIFTLSVLVVIALVLHLATNKELNRMKYPNNVKPKKKKGERQVNEFLDVFSQKN